jgi:hypothetical protein
MTQESTLMDDVDQGKRLGEPLSTADDNLHRCFALMTSLLKGNIRYYGVYIFQNLHKFKVRLDLVLRSVLGLLDDRVHSLSLQVSEICLLPFNKGHFSLHY